MIAGQGRHGQFGPAPGARVRTPQERDAILDQQVMAVASQGGRVETRTADAVVVATGKPVNHVLHLLLSLFVCTMWVPVWLIMAAVGGERRAAISVDPTGGVHRQQAPIRRVGSFRLSWLPSGVCSFCGSSPPARRRSAITRDGEDRVAGIRLRVRVVVLDSDAGVAHCLPRTKQRFVCGT